MSTLVSTSFLIDNLSMSINIDVDDTDTIAAFKQKLRQQLAADKDFQKKIGNNSFNIVLEGLQGKDSQILIEQLGEYDSVRVNIVICAPEAVEKFASIATVAPSKTTTSHAKIQDSLAKLALTPISTAPLATSTSDISDHNDDDLSSGYDSDDHGLNIRTSIPDDTDSTDSELYDSPSSSPSTQLSTDTTLKTAPISVEPLKTFAPVTAPNPDQLSTKIMTSRLTKIDYQPLPIAQPLVHGTPTSKRPAKAAIPLDTAPTEEKIHAFKQALNNDPLLELYTELNELLAYCTQNEWGGLRQRIPTGIAIIKQWLNHWVNSNDPKAAALYILKNIGAESETRQQGAKNILKGLLRGRDPFIGETYSALNRLKNITLTNSGAEVKFVTKEITNLIFEQQNELIAAGVDEDKLPSPKIK